MQELLEVRLDGVLVLAQRGADVLGLDGLVQGALLLFELHQALRHRLADKTRLDDLHEVRKALLDLAALGLQAVQVARIAVVLLVVRRRIHGQRHQVLGVVENRPENHRDSILQLLLAHLLQRALLAALGGAIVVVIRPPRPARAGHALQGAPALPAVDLAGQPIARGVVLVHTARPLGTLALVLGELPLHLVEGLLVHQRGHAALDHDVAVAVLANVGAVLEHLVHRLHAELRAPRGAQPLGVQLVADGLHRLALGVLREHPLHERSGVRVHDVPLRGLVHPIAEQLVPVVERVLGVVVHASLDVLGQLAAVILRHGIHQPLDEHALRPVGRDVLRQQAYLAPGVADGALRHRQHVLVAPQTVGLPHDENTGTDFRDLRQHLLEPRSVLRGARYGRVLVLLHDFEPVGVRPRMRKLPLLVDARLVLRMGGESVVGDGDVVVVQLELLLACQALTPSHNFCLYVFIAFNASYASPKSFSTTSNPAASAACSRLYK